MEKRIGTGLGIPRKFLTDNRAEFANEDFKDMWEHLNKVIMKTATESPFNNGFYEINYAAIDEMVHKSFANQPNCKLSVALAGAVHAKKFQTNGWRI